MKFIKRNIIFALLGFVLAAPMTFAPTASASEKQIYGNFSCYKLVYRDDQRTSENGYYETAFEKEIELKKKGKIIVRVSSEVDAAYGCKWKVEISINGDWEELYGPRYFAPTQAHGYWGTFTGNYWRDDVPSGTHKIKVSFRGNNNRKAYVKYRTLEITSDQFEYCEEEEEEEKPCGYEYEAEDMHLYSSSVKKYDDEASGDYCVYAPSSWGKQLDRDDIDYKIAEHDFYVDNSDTFYLWARMKEPNGNSNSYWLQVDDREPIKWRLSHDKDEWHWDKKELGYISQGQHTFKLWNRESGTRMDKFCITSEERKYGNNDYDNDDDSDDYDSDDDSDDDNGCDD